MLSSITGLNGIFKSFLLKLCLKKLRNRSSFPPKFVRSKTEADTRMSTILWPVYQMQYAKNPIIFYCTLSHSAAGCLVVMTHSFLRYRSIALTGHCQERDKEMTLCGPLLFSTTPITVALFVLTTRNCCMVTERENNREMNTQRTNRWILKRSVLKRGLCCFYIVGNWSW